MWFVSFVVLAWICVEPVRLTESDLTARADAMVDGTPERRALAGDVWLLSLCGFAALLNAALLCAFSKHSPLFGWPEYPYKSCLLFWLLLPFGAIFAKLLSAPTQWAVVTFVGAVSLFALLANGLIVGLMLSGL